MENSAILDLEVAHVGKLVRPPIAKRMQPSAHLQCVIPLPKFGKCAGIMCFNEHCLLDPSQQHEFHFVHQLVLIPNSLSFIGLCLYKFCDRNSSPKYHVYFGIITLEL